MSKALTICQPYAHLIMIGEKRIENRTWPTSYRGTLYIHAGKSREWMDEDDLKDYPRMAFGAVVAISTLVDCLHVVEIQLGKHDRKYPWLRVHDHTSGPWCWVLENVSPIGPWPWRGAQGLWDIDGNELDRVATKIIELDERP